MIEALGLRALKSFEEEGPVIVWQVQAPSCPTHKKLFLILDGNQKTFGIRIEAARSDDIKVAGAFVTQLRRQIPKAYIAGILVDKLSQDYWVPFFMGQTGTPSFWIQLAHSSPPELRLIDHSGVIHVRKSSQGSYTKKRESCTPLPPWPPSDTFEDILGLCLTPWQDKGSFGKQPEEAPEGWEKSLSQDPHEADLGTAAAVQQEGVPDLPEYQKTARDRLARRAKTLRKSLMRLTEEKAAASDLTRWEKSAELLKSHIHQLTFGMKELTVTDETGQKHRLELNPSLPPGAQLDHAYEKVKKMRRAGLKLTAEIERAGDTLKEAEEDLRSLRSQVLPLKTVEALLERHRIALEKPTQSTKTGVIPQALPYKVYLFKSDLFKNPVPILVGKGAEGSDTMLKAARANDLWFHIVGSTGSHVIIPAKNLGKEGAPDELLRSAGILAVFHSKEKNTFAGEVYFARRQNIRKRKGMAPGLWQIDKAQTTVMRFDADELKKVLDMAAP